MEAPDALEVAESTAGRDLRTTVQRVAFVALFVAAVGYSQAADLSAEVSVAVVPFILAIALHLAPLVWPAKSDPFSPVGFIGLYGGLGLVASLITIIGSDRVELRYVPAMSAYAKEELIATLAWSYVIAHASYLAGYYWPRRSIPSVPRLSRLQWDPSRLLLVTIVCFGIALPVYAWFQSRLGTDLSDVTQLAKGKAVWRDDPTQTWVLRGMMLAYIPAMLGLALAVERRSLATGLALLALIAVEGVLVLRAGQRGITIIFFVTCIAMVHYMWRRIPTSLIVVGAFVGVVASNILVQYRTQDADQVNISPFRDRISATQELQEHEGDRQRLSTVAVIFYYFPDKQDFLWGQSWSGLIATPIPRWLWPEKAKHFVWRDSYMVNHLVGAPVPAPYHAVLYANFSWFGVVVGLFGWGLFQRRFYDWAMVRSQDKNIALVYANSLFITSPTLLALSLFVQFELPLLMILLFVGRLAVGKPVQALAGRA